MKSMAKEWTQTERLQPAMTISRTTARVPAVACRDATEGK
jgi:hypothetical protein